MHSIKLIALDLDGTLLNSRKELAQTDRDALAAAARNDIEIVPTTGRFYNAMPADIRNLPFIHYAITMNGAEVLDLCHNKSLFKAEIPKRTAISLIDYLDSCPVIYDCYKNGHAYMNAFMKEVSGEYISDIHFLSMVQSLRIPVNNLKSYIQKKGGDVQKMIAFFKDSSYREILLNEVQIRFPELAITSSIPGNIEINSKDANKGRALLSLASFLGFSQEQTMGFGDGMNDLTMIQAAGVGVAMANAIPDILEAADYVSDDNDSCGVANAIKHFGLISQ